VTGNATNYKNKQGDNPVCSTRDEISQPSRPISSRAATALHCYRIDAWAIRRPWLTFANAFANSMLGRFYTAPNSKICFVRLA